MNVYEDEGLEQKFEELTDLMGQLVLDILMVSLRKVNKENLVFQEWAEVKLTMREKKTSP